MYINARCAIVRGVHRAHIHGSCQAFHAFEVVIPSIEHQSLMCRAIRKRRESLSLFQRIRIEERSIVIVEVNILR